MSDLPEMPSDSYWELEKDGFTSTNRADAMNKDEVFCVNTVAEEGMEGSCDELSSSTPIGHR